MMLRCCDVCETRIPDANFSSAKLSAGLSRLSEASRAYPGLVLAGSVKVTTIPGGGEDRPAHLCQSCLRRLLRDSMIEPEPDKEG